MYNLKWNPNIKRHFDFGRLKTNLLILNSSIRSYELLKTITLHTSQTIHFYVVTYIQEMANIL